MTVPARDSAAAQDPARPGSDPGAAGAWRALIADADLAARVVAELGRDPGNGAALAMARLILEALEALGGITRRCMVDEALLAQAEHQAGERERRAYARGAADCKAARCRLTAVPDT